MQRRRRERVGERRTIILRAEYNPPRIAVKLLTLKAFRRQPAALEEDLLRTRPPRRATRRTSGLRALRPRRPGSHRRPFSAPGAVALALAAAVALTLLAGAQEPAPPEPAPPEPAPATAPGTADAEAPALAPGLPPGIEPADGEDLRVVEPERGSAPGRDERLPEPVYQVWLDARLDDEGVIHGRETLRWRNTSSVPVEDLQVHLYLNAFASNRSTFMVESGGQLRGDEFDEERWGYVEIESISLPGGTDLKPVEQYIAPDDGNPDDRTVVRYPLPEPLPPGAWIDVEIEFESRLPDVFARTGIHGDFVLAGQWYPKIAVFEDAGARGRAEPGWNAHQFHANSEFYADFGDYEVTLTLPDRYQGKIGATGKMQGEPVVAGGNVTVTFAQAGVHDFAWTADPGYLVLTERFDPVADVPEELRRRWTATLGLSAEEIALSPVEITLLLRPENAAQAGRYFRSAKEAIRGYGLRLGAYPYETLTLVDPAWGALGAGGMEYPTFITLATHPLLTWPMFDEVHAPELVTIHEFGHQFFQGMIASNEFEESWLDEGINSYYEMEVMEDEYAPYALRLPGVFATSAFEQQRASIAGGGYSDPVAAPSWGFLIGDSYFQNSYPRPAVTLRHLENLLGPETYHRAMRSFFQRWQFGHPSTADFEAAIEGVAGIDLDWFFDQALHSTRTLDYAVRRVSAKELRDPSGFAWQDGERIELDPDDEEDGEDGEDSEDGDEEDGEDDEPEQWESVVVVFREGEFIHPVTVEMTFDDGRVLRRQWDGDTRWARWTFRGPAEIESAEVDPDGLLALDVDRLNNGRSAEADPAPALAYVTDLLYWLTALFHGAALFA